MFDVLSVPQVEVEDGVDFLQLPFNTTGLPEDVIVVWKDGKSRMVHMYQNGSDQLEEQHQIYRDRTKMNEDLLKNENLSLTLKHPTDCDGGAFMCEVWRNGDIFIAKPLLLKPKGLIHCLLFSLYCMSLRTDCPDINAKKFALMLHLMHDSLTVIYHNGNYKSFNYIQD